MGAFQSGIKIKQKNPVNRAVSSVDFMFCGGKTARMIVLIKLARGKKLRKYIEL